MTCVYGYNNQEINANFYAILSQQINEWKITYNTDKVILGGNHNIAPDSWLDQIPHRNSQPIYNDTILSLRTKTHLIDYWK